MQNSKSMNEAIERLRVAIDWFNYRLVCEKQGKKAEMPKQYYFFRGVMYER